MGSAMGSVLGLISTCHEVGSEVQIVTFYIKIIKWQSVSQKRVGICRAARAAKKRRPKMKTWFINVRFDGNPRNSLHCLR